MSLKVNSIRWGATGECATITRNPELKPKLSKERQTETNAATANEPELKKQSDDRKARTCASHGWRQNGRKRRRNKQ